MKDERMGYSGNQVTGTSEGKLRLSKPYVTYSDRASRQLPPTTTPPATIPLCDNSPLRNFTYLDYLLFSISIRVWQDSFKLCILRSQFDKNDNNNLLGRLINTM